MKENTNTQTTPRLSKKIFVVGKVYDTAMMTDQEIEDAPDMISLVFIRFTGYYGEKSIDMAKEMIDADAFMITGEGYQGFHLPSMFPTVPFGYTPYVMSQSDFKMAYKESSEQLGADKVKWMKTEVTGYSVVLRIK